MVGDKLRFRFRKVGDLRLLSHLDLTRCFERMLRRAQLPFKMSGGFHPTPRMIFALSMPLGCEAFQEVLELELNEPLDAEEVRLRLNSQAPIGLEFHGVTAVPMKASAVARRVVYTLPLPEDRVEDTQRIADGLLAQEKVWVERFKPKPRRINIRPYLRCLSVFAATEGSDSARTLPSVAAKNHSLSLDLWVTTTGSARADELLKLLQVDDLLDAGHLLSRTTLEIQDETPAECPDLPPVGNPETAPLEYTPAFAGDDEPASATWGLSPNGPVVE